MLGDNFLIVNTEAGHFDFVRDDPAGVGARNLRRVDYWLLLSEGDQRAQNKISVQGENKREA